MDNQEATPEYTIVTLSEQLFFIRWHYSPPVNRVLVEFLQDMERLLNVAGQPIYFISDLRRGRIANVETLLKLSNLADHPYWGGGTSFSRDRGTSLYTGVFAQFARKHGVDDKTYDTPEEALAYLESLAPQITAGIDWLSLINGH